MQRRFLDAGLGKPRVTLLWSDRNSGGNNSGNSGNSGGTDANAPSALVEVGGVGPGHTGWAGNGDGRGICKQ